jgi:hypothetical protein
MYHDEETSSALVSDFFSPLTPRKRALEFLSSFSYRFRAAPQRLFQCPMLSLDDRKGKEANAKKRLICGICRVSKEI